jgi:hypothetical protein
MIDLKSESSAGFATIDKILENILKYQNKNASNSQNKSEYHSFLDCNQIPTEKRSLLLNETKSKNNIDNYKMRQFNLGIKRDYSLSYSDTNNIFSERLPKKLPNEFFQQKLKNVLLKNKSYRITPCDECSNIEKKDETLLKSHSDQKRIKRKKSVSFNTKTTLFSYSYATNTLSQENENCNLLAQSILSKLDSLLDEESRDREVINENKIVEETKKIYEIINVDNKEFRDNESSDREVLDITKEEIIPLELNEDEEMNNQDILEENICEMKTPNEKNVTTPAQLNENGIVNEKEIFCCFTQKLNSVSNSNQKIDSPEQNDSLSQKYQNNFEMKATLDESSEPKKAAEINKPLRFFLIERLAQLVEVDKKRNESIRHNPQEEQINLAFDKIERLLHQNGKLNRQKSRLSNAFSTYINNIV